MEFATKVVGTKIIIVLGHTKCGAIVGACNNVKLGKLTGLLDKVMPAVKGEKVTNTDRNGSNPSFVNNVTSLNVKLTIDRIRKESQIVQELEEQKHIKIIGAVYDVDNGKVDFFE